MDLEVGDGLVRPRRVELPGAVVAADARQVHEFNIRWRLCALGDRDWYFGLLVYGGVAHHALERVVGVLFEQVV